MRAVPIAQHWTWVSTVRIAFCCFAKFVSMIENSRSMPMLTFSKALIHSDRYLCSMLFLTPTQGTLLPLGSNMPTRPSYLSKHVLEVFEPKNLNLKSDTFHLQQHCQQAPPLHLQAQLHRSPRYIGWLFQSLVTFNINAQISRPQCSSPAPLPDSGQNSRCHCREEREGKMGTNMIGRPAAIEVAVAQEQSHVLKSCFGFGTFSKLASCGQWKHENLPISWTIQGFEFISFSAYPAAFPRVPPPRTFGPTLRSCPLPPPQDPSHPPSLSAPKNSYDRFFTIFFVRKIYIFPFCSVRSFLHTYNHSPNTQFTQLTQQTKMQHLNATIIMWQRVPKHPLPCAMFTSSQGALSSLSTALQMLLKNGQTSRFVVHLIRIKLET